VSRSAFRGFEVSQHSFLLLACGTGRCSCENWNSPRRKRLGRIPQCRMLVHPVFTHIVKQNSTLLPLFILFATPLWPVRRAWELTYAGYNRSPNTPVTAKNTPQTPYSRQSLFFFSSKPTPEKKRSAGVKNAETHLTAHPPVSPTRTSTRPKNRMRNT
jgi:hypothetical protein